MMRKALKSAGAVLAALALVAAAIFVGPRLLPTPQETGLGGPAPSASLVAARTPSASSSPSVAPAPSPSATSGSINLGCFDPSAPAEPFAFTNPDGSSGPEPPDGRPYIQAARTLATFAGIWVNEFRAEVHVAVTCDVDVAIAAIGHLFPPDQTVYFHLVEHTYAELESLLGRVFAERDALLVEDLYLSYGAVDEKRNVVEIGIDPLTPAVVDEMKSRYGQPIEFVHSPRPFQLSSPWPTDPEMLIAVRSPVGAERMVTCGGVPFPASLLEGNVEDMPADLAEDLRAAARFWRSEFPGLERLTWRLIHRDEDSAAFLARSDDGGAEWIHLGLDRDSEGWSPSGVGGCRPSGVLDGFGVAQWVLDPAYPAPKPGTTELNILVTEHECASGQPAFGRMSAPVVTYAPDALTLTVGVRPIGGNCPSNPQTPATVILPEPLGKRVLLDGGRHPPRPPLPED